MSTRPSFAHRPNHDETFDSICRTCYRTVADHVGETDLEQAEREHVCDTRVLEHLQSFRERETISQFLTDSVGFPSKQ